MAQFFKGILLVTLSLIGINCASNTGSTTVATTSTPTPTYSINQALVQGLDDTGNMQVEVDGSFSGINDEVALNCDGLGVGTSVVSDSSTAIVISAPAASFYNACTFRVYSGGVGSTPFVIPLNSLSISGVSNEVLDPNDNTKMDVELDGHFFVTPIVSSTAAVEVTCNGGASFSAPILSSLSSQAENVALVIQIPDPGANVSENCVFTVSDSFQDTQNNITKVQGAGFQTQITGI